MKLDQIQQEHKIWTDKNFPDAPAYHSLLGIGEEVGELFHAQLKQEQGIRGTVAEHTAAKRDAVGDIIIYLMHYCSFHDWSLMDIVDETWQEVKKRDWTKNKKNGNTGKLICSICGYECEDESGLILKEDGWHCPNCGKFT